MKYQNFELKLWFEAFLTSSVEEKYEENKKWRSLTIFGSLIGFKHKINVILKAIVVKAAVVMIIFFSLFQRCLRRYFNNWQYSMKKNLLLQLDFQSRYVISPYCLKFISIYPLDIFRHEEFSKLMPIF